MTSPIHTDSDQRSDPTSVVLSDAEAVLHELRPALAAILEHLQPPVRRPSELRRLLGLDQNLSWRVYSAGTASDARALASLLPGKRAMERFFVAAALHDVPASTLDRARAAFDRFEQSVARHAGSRDAFETMMSEHRTGSDQDWEGGATDFKHKRAAFRANSLMWGRQARVFCTTKIVHPSDASGAGIAGMLDGVFIKGVVGLQRTRRSVPLQTTAHHWRTPNPGEPANPNPPEPLDPRDSGEGSIGLLRDFCSQPIPEFRLRVSRQGYRSHEMISTQLGPAGEVTYFTGEIRRSETAAPGSIPGAEVMLFKAVDFPLEVFNADILVHRSLWDTRPPDVKVFAIPLDGSTEFRDSDLLPLAETAKYLGDGIDAARTPLIPRYSEILSYTMDRMQWKAEEFRVFRCRVDFPVLYTRIRLTLG